MESFDIAPGVQLELTAENCGGVAHYLEAWLAHGPYIYIQIPPLDDPIIHKRVGLRSVKAYPVHSCITVSQIQQGEQSGYTWEIPTGAQFTFTRYAIEGVVLAGAGMFYTNYFIQE